MELVWGRQQTGVILHFERIEWQHLLLEKARHEGR